ncbi:MAG: YihY/virulence factor BrkB family protein [Actinomycetia bacterium]|nr:YihY/virulence factor BrkB family protein [Actinomycetes bacterium]
MLTVAARQAQEAGSDHQYAVLLVGRVASLITGMTALGQFERSFNRIYGVEQDRASVQKYTRAAVLAVTVGMVASIGITMPALGRPIAEAVAASWAVDVWLIVRWPLAIVLLMVGASAVLALFLRWSTTFVDTYGPTAGMIGLLLWVLRGCRFWALWDRRHGAARAGARGRVPSGRAGACMSN